MVVPLVRVIRFFVIINSNFIRLVVDFAVAVTVSVAVALAAGGGAVAVGPSAAADAAGAAAAAAPRPARFRPASPVWNGDLKPLRLCPHPLALEFAPPQPVRRRELAPPAASQRREEHLGRAVKVVKGVLDGGDAREGVAAEAGAAAAALG